MKIVYNNNVNKISFTELREGDVFKYNDILFMKTIFIPTKDKTYNAIRLDNGHYTDFLDEYVEPVKGKFVMD
jgi:hypothetical protein